MSGTRPPPKPSPGHFQGIPTKKFLHVFFSGKKKQHKHKLFGPDFPRTFLTLTPECPGVKKFLPTTGAAGKRTFWCGRPRFSARTSMTRRVAEKLCTKKVCVDFLAPIFVSLGFSSQSRFWERRGCDKALFSEKKGVFSDKGGGNSVNEGFGKDSYRKANSVKRSGPYSEPPDSEK